MSDVPMPVDLSEEAVAEWLYDDAPKCVLYEYRHAKTHAAAVLALVREKVREAVVLTLRHCESTPDRAYRELGEPLAVQQEIDSTNEIVSRVMGDHPSNASGGHEPREGREEAPRG